MKIAKSHQLNLNYNVVFIIVLHWHCDFMLFWWLALQIQTACIMDGSTRWRIKTALVNTCVNWNSTLVSAWAFIHSHDPVRPSEGGSGWASMDEISKKKRDLAWAFAKQQRKCLSEWMLKGLVNTTGFLSSDTLACHPSPVWEFLPF